jgi:hypothetical protein
MALTVSNIIALLATYPSDLEVGNDDAEMITRFELTNYALFKENGDVTVHPYVKFDLDES